MKPIQPITLWIGGETQTANVFSLRIINDDLKSYAQLYYQLGNETPAPDPAEASTVQWLQDGNLAISGADYQQWNNEPDANTWIYNWSAAKLNLVII